MMHRITLRYGFLSALLLLISFGLSWMLFGTRLDYRTAEVLGYLSILVALSLIFFGMKAYRDQAMDGQLSFGQGFRAGLFILLLPSLGIFFFTVIYFYLAGDRFFEYMEAQLPPEQWAQYEAAREWFVNPWFQGAVMLGTVLALGLVVVLVSAMILRRRQAAART